MLLSQILKSQTPSESHGPIFSGRLRATALSALAFLCSSQLFGTQSVSPDLGVIGDPKQWVVSNGQVEASVEAGVPVARLAPIGGNRQGSNLALALVKNLNFSEGVIDVDLRGSGEKQGSFLGIAFGVTADGKHEAIYFRPFNFRAEDPVRHAHAVQYISFPDYPWERLRKETPGRYENPLEPAPDPDGWFHARIEVSARRVEVYVNGAAQPCLSVERLGNASSGGVGLWVDSKVGAFAKLQIQNSP